MDPNLNKLSQPAIKALANPQRYELWQFFEGFQISVSDIAAEIEFSQPTVSKHLKILEEAGLVRHRREGRRVFYETTDQAPSDNGCV